METLLQFHDLILCITCALEARDAYTSHHSSRVAEMTEGICTYMGLSEEETELYHISAHLHDIGKIGIQDDILRKNGPLSEEEWKLMRSHAEKGYQILVNVPSFREVAAIVRSHHERYDGKGYPDGLAAEQIPLGSRIIAIADSIDAMLSDRPYRKAMDPVKCQEQIRKNTGTMYDPAAAECVLKNWDVILRLRAKEAPQCSLTAASPI